MTPLRSEQKPLVAFLLDQAGIALDLDAASVEPLHDGGMGSIRLCASNSERRFGENAAECSFNDSDGQLVTAALYLDTDGAPLEVDVWKVDFTSLLRWPAKEDLTATASARRRPNKSLERSRDG